MTNAPIVVPEVSTLTVGVLGGTGEQGRGLAFRLAAAGQRVLIGSRDPARAQLAADEIGYDVSGRANEECAAESDLVVVAVPWAGLAHLLAGLVDHLAG